MWVRLSRLVQWLTMSCVFSSACFPQVRAFRPLAYIYLLVALDNVHNLFGDTIHNLFSFHAGAYTFCHDIFTDISAP